VLVETLNPAQSINQSSSSALKNLLKPVLKVNLTLTNGTRRRSFIRPDRFDGVTPSFATFKARF